MQRQLPSSRRAELQGRRELAIPRKEDIVLLALVLVLPALLWATYVAAQVVTDGERDDTRLADAIVVLGTTEYSGWPSRPFGARLDHALSLYEEGLAPVVIVAGGDPEGDSYTEAAAGVRYLEHQGLPPDALLTVQGNNMYENLAEVKALTKREGLETVLLVSERFHILRSLIMDEDLDIQAYASPTSTSPTDHNPASRFYATYERWRLTPPTCSVLVTPPLFSPSAPSKLKWPYE